MLDTKTDHPFMLLVTLRRQIRLNLIHRGNDFVVTDKVNEPVGIEVRNADGPDKPLAVHLLQLPPRGIDISVRPMQEDKVNVIRAEFGQ